MELEKMITSQRVLRKHIIENNNLHGMNLLPNITLALLVEISEFANETRCFKHWSTKGPSSKEKILEEYVDGVHFFLDVAIEKGWEDSLFIYEDALLEVQEQGLYGGLTGAILEVNYFICKSYMEKHKEEDNPFKNIYSSRNEFEFKSAWFVYVCIGVVGLGFELEEIEEAYYKKNKINHERQESGY